MDMTQLDSVYRLAMDLPADERIRLAERLLLEAPPEDFFQTPEVRERWSTEIRRRMEMIDQGGMGLTDHQTVMMSLEDQ